MPRRLLLGLILCLLIALAGCGGGDNDGTTAATEGTETEGAETAVDAATAQRVEELIKVARQPQEGKSQKESLRIADARGELLTIAAENPAAIQPLLDALEKPDYELIIDLHGFYIQLGKPGSEKVLADALQRLEDSPSNSVVALTYFESGNKKLVSAAEKWASDHGYTITGGPRVSPTGWGSGGVYGPALPPGVQQAPGP
jgi:hypothetical protein